MNSSGAEKQERGNMDSDKITIVTGFFDCNRGEHATQARTVDDYLRYFEFWAGLQNELVVFTYADLVPKVEAIREKYGRIEQTKVVSVESIWDVEPTILRAMEEVERRGEYKRWRMYSEDISNEARYSYVMLMKYWCVKEAVARGFAAEGSIAWLDFGWNHGGVYYTNSEEFTFEWRYPFERAIHMFTRKDINEELGFIKLQNMRDSIMGTFVVATDMVDELYEYMCEAMRFLLSLDCFDDDQMLLRIVYRLHGERCRLHNSDWYTPISQFGNNALSARNAVEESSSATHEKDGAKRKIQRLLAVLRSGTFREYIRWRLFKCIRVEDYCLKEYDQRLNELLQRYDN